MDLKTAVYILVQQCGQLSNLMIQLQNQSFETQRLIDQENSISDPIYQIKSMMASMSIVMSAINSQDVVVQQAIDKVSELSV